MRIRKIKWKKHATLKQLRNAENRILEQGGKIFTQFKIFENDLWTTYVEWA